MNITWKYVKPLKDESVVDAFLDKYHVELPTKLIDLIKKYNGGRPSEKTILTCKKVEYVFKSLLSYNIADKETVFSFYPSLFIGTSLYPIGSDAAGNFICFDTKKKQYFLCNHETGENEAIIEMGFLC